MTRERKQVSLVCETCGEHFSRRADKKTPPRCRTCCRKGINIKDVTGVSGDNFTVLGATNDRTYSQGVVWCLQCTCGNLFKAPHSSIKMGLKTLSCGCKRYTKTENSRSKTSEYKSYYMMLDRCTNKNSPFYHLYGGRGITVCGGWKEPAPTGFDNFLQDIGCRPTGTSLDRINVNGNYTPENCRWADDTIQGHNKRKRGGCTSKFIGVSLVSGSNTLWRAYVTKDNIRHDIGSYPSEVEAAVVRDYHTVLLYGENSVTNFPISFYEKALCAGLRGHKNRLTDLQDIKASIERAIEMHKEWN